MLFESPRHKKHEYGNKLNLVFSFKIYKRLKIEGQKKKHARGPVWCPCACVPQILSPSGCINTQSSKQLLFHMVQSQWVAMGTPYRNEKKFFVIHHIIVKTSQKASTLNLKRHKHCPLHKTVKKVTSLIVLPIMFIYYVYLRYLWL